MCNTVGHSPEGQSAMPTSKVDCEITRQPRWSIGMWLHKKEPSIAVGRPGASYTKRNLVPQTAFSRFAWGKSQTNSNRE